MAYEMQIRETGDNVKIRSPWAAALLPFVTLGIYHLVWWYRINRELRDYGKAKGYDLGQNPTNSVLALFPGGIIIIPALVTYWRGTKRVMGAMSILARNTMLPSGCLPSRISRKRARFWRPNENSSSSSISNRFF